MTEIGNDCFDEFLELLKIPETRKVLLEFKEKIKIIFKDKIEDFEKIKKKANPAILEPGEEEPDKIIHMNQNWKQHRGLLTEYEFEDRELREFIHYLLTFPFFCRMVL